MRQAAKIPAAADVRKQADARFGHGELGVLGRHAERRRLADTDPAAHRDPVHEGDHRLGVGEQLVVELVLGVEELAPGLALVIEGRVAQHRDIAARAEAAPFGMVDHHRRDTIVAGPLGQRIGHRDAHLGGQRMYRLGAIERDMTHVLVGVDVELVGHAASLCSMRSQRLPHGSLKTATVP